MATNRVKSNKSATALRAVSRLNYPDLIHKVFRRCCICGFDVVLSLSLSCSTNFRHIHLMPVVSFDNFGAFDF